LRLWQPQLKLGRIRFDRVDACIQRLQTIRAHRVVQAPGHCWARTIRRRSRVRGDGCACARLTVRNTAHVEDDDGHSEKCKMYVDTMGALQGPLKPTPLHLERLCGSPVFSPW
jgi:hypothetical protein